MCRDSLCIEYVGTQKTKSLTEEGESTLQDNLSLEILIRERKKRMHFLSVSILLRERTPNVPEENLPEGSQRARDR